MKRQNRKIFLVLVFPSCFCYSLFIDPPSWKGRILRNIIPLTSTGDIGNESEDFLRTDGAAKRAWLFYSPSLYIKWNIASGRVWRIFFSPINCRTMETTWIEQAQTAEIILSRRQILSNKGLERENRKKGV